MVSGDIKISKIQKPFRHISLFISRLALKTYDHFYGLKMLAVNRTHNLTHFYLASHLFDHVSILVSNKSYLVAVIFFTAV